MWEVYEGKRRANIWEDVNHELNFQNKKEPAGKWAMDRVGDAWE